MENYENIGSLHNHSDNSKFDGAMKPTELVKRAKELGFQAVSLTDHGIKTGIDEFLKACAENEIKPIPGVELYVKEDGPFEKREHLILYELDSEGSDVAGEIVTESNRRLDGAFPTVNKEVLRKFILNGRGLGHIIGTSACIGGPIATILLTNFNLEERHLKLEKEQAKKESPHSSSHVRNKDTFVAMEEALKGLIDQRTLFNAASKKSLRKIEVDIKKNEKKLDIVKTDSERSELESKIKKAKEELLQGKREKEGAMELLTKVRLDIAALKKEMTALNKRIQSAEKSHQEWIAIEKEKETIKKSLTSEDILFERAKAEALEYEEIFGKGNFFLELQFHGIDRETYVMPKIVKISEETGIPLVAANDAHITTNTEENLLKRQILRSLRFNKWEDRNIGDDELYIKTADELAFSLERLFSKEIVKKAMDGIKTIVDRCNYEPKNEHHYPVYISDVEGENAVARLRRLSEEGINWRFPNGEWDDEYRKRLEYELSVIEEMGFSDYLCIVEDFLRYGRVLGKIDFNNPPLEYVRDPYNLKLLEKIVEGEVGLGIGPGRGSAAGSLVCYLVGITDLDPMKYSLLFERFLNVERVSMPDIDSDFLSTNRDKVIDYVKNKYGKDAVCNIVTKDTQAVRGSIRNCARLLGSQLYGETDTFLSLGDMISKSVPKDVGIKFKDCKEGLLEQFGDDSNAVRIIENASLVEGTLVGYGMHAAGVIISDNDDVGKYTPLMWDTKNETWKCQCDMNEAEAKGLLKMDFLGLRNLDIITDTLRLIKKQKGVSIDINNIPFVREVFDKIFSLGFTNSIFQFESPGMKQMLKQFKPESFEDTILLVAAYRPGPMQYLERIINVKHKREPLTYLTPELEPILKDTYGSIIYQEQVMQIFQYLAGYSLGQADLVRRAMSKKKDSVLAKEKDAFIYGDEERNIKGCKANGIDEKKADILFEEMRDFAKYAFNKSHAAAYAVVAYQTAWLKHFYPTEYLCSVMTHVSIDKIPGLIDDCKRLNINVLAPDINESDVGFTISNDDILFGLGSVKNVGAAVDIIVKERNNHGKFTSFKDFLKRGHFKKDVTESLIGAGALDAFFPNRYAMSMVVEEAGAVLKKIKTKKLDIEDFELRIFEEEDEKEKLKLEKRLENARKALIKLNERFDITAVPETIPEHSRTRLENEKDLIGVYVSAHPLDEYQDAKEIGCKDIIDLVPAKKVSIFGIVTNLRKTTRKSDGSPMAFFTLEDKTSKVEVNCFTKAFAEYGEYIEEGEIFKIEGSCFEEEDFMDEEKMVTKVNIFKILPVTPIRESVIIHINNMVEWILDIGPIVKNFRIGSEGYPLVIHDRTMGELRQTEIFVSKEILTNKRGLVVSMN